MTTGDDDNGDEQVSLLVSEQGDLLDGLRDAARGDERLMLDLVCRQLTKTG